MLTAAQVYLVTHFCFYYYYYLLHFFFLSARDNETIRDQLTSWKSPLARRVSHCLFCVLKNCRHSHRQALSLYLYVAGRNNIHHPLPSAPASHTQECDFSTIFSNFQTILVAFFPQQVHTNKPSDFFEKTLAIVHLEDVSSTAPRARGLTLLAQCRLSLRLFCAVSSILLAVTQQNHQ